uniref:Glycoside-hydrolase family GH114 TIM-barrel domain-containing protein n=1 Tax=Arcella intermedia TaxID=1963864 RepID=A0A6B2LDN7_9EUKA
MKVVDLDVDSQRDLIPSLVGAGHIVLCYFSVGSLEPWRQDCQANKTLWMSAAVGSMSGWDEEWLDIRKLDLLQSLMIPRFQRALQEGCHGVEPDNIDCYENQDCWGQMTNPSVSSGDDVKQAQLTYNTWQVSYAHSLGLAIAMKNAVGLLPDLAGLYDCAVNEQCQTYTECDGYLAFTGGDKAVFQVQYSNDQDWCSGAQQWGLQTKYCAGTGDNLCSSGQWSNCFDPEDPLPPTQWTN